MPEKIILTGLKFGSLTVVSEAEQKGYATRWNCVCDCGNTRVVYGNSLRGGRTRSCGCSRGTHHMWGTPTYKVWHNMLQRCNNPKAKHYNNYGGRGIRVCKRWNKFENFLEDMGVRPKGLKIDRIDNDGNYEPDNCEWVTHTKNNRNRRNNRLLTYDGQTRCLTEWASIIGVSDHLIRGRIKMGWSIERSLTQGVDYPDAKPVVKPTIKRKKKEDK